MMQRHYILRKAKEALSDQRRKAILCRHALSVVGLLVRPSSARFCQTLVLTPYSCRAEMRASQGPRESPTGAYVVVREDWRRPRKHGGDAYRRGTRKFPVALPEGPHPFPSRSLSCQRLAVSFQPMDFRFLMS